MSLTCCAYERTPAPAARTPRLAMRIFLNMGCSRGCGANAAVGNEDFFKHFFCLLRSPECTRASQINRCHSKAHAGIAPRRAPPFLGRPRKEAKKPPRMPGPFGVRCGARLCRAAPNSLRYAPFRQGARSQTLMALRAARQILRSSPRQHGVTQNTNTPRCSGRAIEPPFFLAPLVQDPLNGPT